MARNYRHDIIDGNDYYLCNGMGHLLLGAKLYCEAESAYASMSPGEQSEASRFIPILTDIKWSSNLMRIRQQREDIGRVVDKSLHFWLKRQRSYVRDNTLSQEKLDVLNAMVPKVVRSANHSYTPRTVRNDVWEANLQKLASFVEAEGRLPNENADVEERICVWLRNQKTRHKLGALSEDRIKKLDEAVPAWRVVQRERYRWEDMLNEAHAFMQEKGTLPREGKDPDESRLARWMARQRETRRPPSPERIALLNDRLPGWDADPRDGDWEASLDNLHSFILTNGSTPLLRNNNANERNLSNYMRYLLKRYHANTLTPERRAKVQDKMREWENALGSPVVS